MRFQRKLTQANYKELPVMKDIIQIFCIINKCDCLQYNTLSDNHILEFINDYDSNVFDADIQCYVFSLPGVALLPAVDSKDLQTIMRLSFAVVNSSISEGMATSLIEVLSKL